MQFLQGPAAYAKELYILGDLFDAWVGADINRDFQNQIQTALNQLKQKGVDLYYMAGNRDFLMEQHFIQAAGCKKLSDPTIISLHGIKTLLTHGDTLCTQDITYQRYRRVAQHPLTRFLFLHFPKTIRQNIGKKLRMKSQQYQQGQSFEILDVCKVTVQKTMAKQNIKQLIHGHVHRPALHHVNLLYPAKRAVLGDWNAVTASLILATPTQLCLATYDTTAGICIKDSYALLK